MLACRSLLQCPQQGGAGLSCLRYTCLVFTVRFLESSSRTPSTSARSHQRASRGEGPCACSLYYFLKWHNQPFTAEDAEDAKDTRRRIREATLHPGLITADRIFSFCSAGRRGRCGGGARPGTGFHSPGP